MRLSVFSNYLRWHRDRLIVLAAVLAVMVFGVLNGLLAAIAFSLAMLVRSLATPRLSVLGRVGAHDYVSVARFPAAITEPSMLVLRPEEPLFFANAEPLLTQVRERVLAQPAARILVLSLEESPDLDSTALEALAEFGAWFAARGGELRLARLKDDAREALARAAGAQLTARGARLFKRGRCGAGASGSRRESPTLRRGGPKVRVWRVRLTATGEVLG